MHQQDDVQSLRNEGYRLTRQRLLILELIRASNQHITADEIYAQVKQQHPKINVATVYRTLQWLHHVGLIRKIDVGEDRLQYECASAASHHHLVCRDCGTETEIDNHVIEGMHAHLFEHYGFAAETDHVAIFGRCAQCQQPHSIQ